MDEWTINQTQSPDRHCSSKKEENSRWTRERLTTVCTAPRFLERFFFFFNFQPKSSSKGLEKKD